MTKNFAIIGCGGFVAPRHLQAIKETDNELVAALDKHDSVGLLDNFFNDVHFFTEFERFDRHVEKLRRVEDKKINYVSICSPNYLHDAHVRFAFRVGADAICEKPLALNPWNLDALEKLEEETGRKVWNILQLRLHPSLIELKEKIGNELKSKKHDIDLTYITPRGKWYHHSWKGQEDRSGGLVTNLGVHFFDMLIWIFGDVKDFEVHYKDQFRTAGFLDLEKARVRWFLSVRKDDLPEDKRTSQENKAHRSIKIDNKELEFSSVFTDLHTEAYKRILAGEGFGIKDARPSIEVVQKIRDSGISVKDKKHIHPMLGRNRKRNRKKKK